MVKSQTKYYNHHPKMKIKEAVFRIKRREKQVLLFILLSWKDEGNVSHFFVRVYQIGFATVILREGSIVMLVSEAFLSVPTNQNY
jgi:hypothetical protein